MNRHGWREVRRQLSESRGIGLVAVLLLAIALTWGVLVWGGYRLAHEVLLGSSRSATVVAAAHAGRAEDLAAALGGAFPRAAYTLAEPGRTKEELAGWFPELSSVLLGLEDGAFPTLLRVNVSAAEATGVSTWLRARPETVLVQSSRDWQERIEQTLSRVTLAGLALALALLLACTVVVLLAIRLLVLEHAEEIAIMRLIGARERDIRRPYLVCGGVVGGAGGVVATAVLAGVWLLLRSHLEVPDPLWLLAGVPALGAVLGTAGAAAGLAALPSDP